MLRLPEILRIHSVLDPRTSHGPPERATWAETIRNTRPARATAISCQGHQSPSRCASTPMMVKRKLACSIHTYGTTDGFFTGVRCASDGQETHEHCRTPFSPWSLEQNPVRKAGRQEVSDSMV